MQVSDPAPSQMTVDHLAEIVQQLRDSGSGDIPVAVNVGDRLVLPVLHSAVRSHEGHAYLELRAPDLPRKG
ncbi:hypothetical protein SAMN02982929_00760 [Saccharopolyspora kobensis]|uniref:Uncharacterized protein n=1 Tax=Saccharopolyspora kobensis TaxID=146035 RepID=A0A1H5V3R4_9PSEU|nr:hypothetical protein [Saccharopolyspora kobensis]SEF82102.1 hypothetical protein SAMN02982929_00760 [Saccharopolyspora kobensis]SFC65475.1 hypothetical protein SAMN05216506_1011311 [Saccharopolyspora kobensis]